MLQETLDYDQRLVPTSGPDLLWVFDANHVRVIQATPQRKGEWGLQMIPRTLETLFLELSRVRARIWEFLAENEFFAGFREFTQIR